MAAGYQYFGVYGDRDPQGLPMALFRTWTTPDGVAKEEGFTRDLRWQPSYWTSPMSRPGFYDDDYEPVDDAKAMRFLEYVRDLHGHGESLEELLEARPLIRLRIRKVSEQEALTLILSARRPADAPGRRYLYSESDTLIGAYSQADDDGQLRLRDVAERLLAERGDDCPMGAVNVLECSPWGMREPERLERLVRRYVEHGPLHLVGRILWDQSSWIKPAQVKALEAAAAGDPLRHLPVCAVVLKQSFFATGTVWESIAALLRTSMDLEILARLRDVVVHSNGGGDYYAIMRKRHYPPSVLEEIEARTHQNVY